MHRRFEETKCPPHDFEHALFQKLGGYTNSMVRAWWICRKCGELKVVPP